MSVRAEGGQLFYIGGIYSTNKRRTGDIALGETLDGAHGPENVVFNNSIVSKDVPIPDRFDGMATDFMTRVQQGPLDVVVLSLGSTEFWRVIKIVRKKDKNFFDKDNDVVKRNLRIIIIGGSGFSKGIKDKLSYARAVKRMKDGMTLDGLTLFPPVGIEPEEISTVLSDVSNAREGVPLVTFRGKSRADRYLSKGEQAILEVLDADLRTTLDVNDIARARQIVKERELLTVDGVHQVFEGSPDPKYKAEKMRYGGINGVRALIRAAGSKPMKEFMRLHRDGFKVKYYIPEYDYMVPFRRIAKVFKGREDEIPKRVHTMQLYSHAGMLLQPEEFVDAIIQSQDND